MRLIDCLNTTEALSAIFSDASVLQALLDFESALARAEAGAGVIPASAADAVADAARAENFDAAVLAREARREGTLALPLVKLLRQRAGFAHHGATSQDAADTALILLLQRCREILHRGHTRLMAALYQLAREHGDTVMLGRTLLQPAEPVTFGLKAAGWHAALARGWVRVDSRFRESAYVQFGGAAGTLSALGDQGLAVAEALAKELGLQCPDAPWHAYRDRLAALLAALSIYTATLGKIALDIALLMQAEVAEAAEPGGGSSALPHKRNPKACIQAIAAAKRVPGLMASYLGALMQEHERAAGGWQSEWPTVEGVVQSAGVALEAMVEAAEGLAVDPARMRENLRLAPETGLGSAEVFRRRLLGEDY